MTLLAESNFIVERNTNVLNRMQQFALGKVEQNLCTGLIITNVINLNCITLVLKLRM
jgi:hypothetical protein